MPTLWTRTTVSGGRRVIAIDGKNLRGAGNRDGVLPHLVTALDQATGAVLAQLATTAKSNKVPHGANLVQGLGPEGHGSHDRCDAYPGRHHPDDPGRCRRPRPDRQGQPPQVVGRPERPRPWKDVPAHSGTDRGRGRRITRTIKVLQAPTALPDQVAFPGAAQVAQLRRTRITTTGKGTNRKTTKTVEVVHVITSADHRAAPPAVPATWVQHHQRIEALHRLRDMDDDEDRSQIRTGTGPETMATLRSTAISLLRPADTKNITAALRRNQAHPEKIITLLTS